MAQALLEQDILKFSHPPSTKEGMEEGNMVMAMGSGCSGQAAGQGFARRGAWLFSACVGGARSLVYEFIQGEFRHKGASAAGLWY